MIQSFLCDPDSSINTSDSNLVKPCDPRAWLRKTSLSRISSQQVFHPDYQLPIFNSKDPEKGIQVKTQNKLVVTVDQGSDNFVYRALTHFVTLTDHCLKKLKFGGHVCDRATFIAMEEATGLIGDMILQQFQIT